ncbi:putative quinol monooxygenase [Swingsia samuiensis]|uniref:Antibiotic biosynthesis monooxygenase n=1 Tax=Swingsia samuiensis TaxID=1293412 RepID=A0A4Y6UKL2_9PROT|nr:putative quinol monooxygenase [Swingsia samuiensis]QDH16931.1 antibiotic biosynthesis monooxygenase [Swingsia samuiensis]
MSGTFIVIAEFYVETKYRAAFLKVCAYDKERSVQDEPGCYSFEVNSLTSDPNLIILIESYENQEAFDLHLKMPHFEKFAQALKDYNVIEKNVRTLTKEIL